MRNKLNVQKKMVFRHYWLKIYFNGGTFVAWLSCNY